MLNDRQHLIGNQHQPGALIERLIGFQNIADVRRAKAIGRSRDRDNRRLEKQRSGSGRRAPPLTEAWRGRVAAACLLIFLAACAARVSWRSLPRRLEAAARWEEPSEELRRKGEGFSFDPDYAAFLQAVRNATPEDAVISVVAPHTHEYYTYQAVFTLAPRRVAVPGEASVPRFTAFYKDDGALMLPGTRRITNGVLLLR